MRQEHYEKDRIRKMDEGVGEAGGQIQKPEINYQALVEHIPAVTYITALDEKGDRLYISPQIEKMLGFPSSAWLTDPQLWFRQIHSDDRKRVLAEFYNSHKNGQPFRSEYRLIGRDGRVIWVRDEANVVRDGEDKPCLIQGVMFDISELLRAKEALQKSEAKFRTIFEGTSLGIAVVNMEGRLIESNPALQKMLGYNGADLYNKVFNELAHPEDSTRDLDLYKKLLEGEHDYYQIEKRFFKKEGGVIWGRLNVSLGKSDGGTPQYTIHILEDITEWKQLEAQFLQSQKMETVGRLAGGIAHDLNNLFTILSGYSQLSLISLQENDPLRGNLEEIKRVTERAAELTHQLLALSRRQVLDLKVVDLNTLVQGLQKMLGRVMGEDIELTTVLDKNLGRVKIDPGQIEQVILNLVVNARDAMSTGGRLILETSNVELDEDYARRHIGVTPGRYVTLSVSDTGCGMSPEVKEQIFDPFFTTKDKGKGTGLGLSTVYGIVKQSGGNIWVYSEPGQGTTFKIYLPQVEEGADTFTSQAEKDDLPQGSEMVLLVEDEPSVRSLTARFLRKQGYTVLEAGNGDEAMQIAHDHREEKIHLLLTDVVMPQMSGKEVVERLKTFYPEIKVLFISGYTETVINHHAEFQTGAPFLQKPFSWNGLAKKVREVLDRS